MTLIGSVDPAERDRVAPALDDRFPRARQAVRDRDARSLRRAGAGGAVRRGFVPFCNYVPFIACSTCYSLTMFCSVSSCGVRLERRGLGHARLPEAVALVNSKPANAVRLEDRGGIAPGLRADLVRVRRGDGVPHLQSVWPEGRRVA